MGRMSSDNFEEIVSQHYEPLYKFAFSLTGNEADASDLTQETFYIWATKGHQLRERSKVKSWLFTTLHREFLNKRKRAVRFPDVELIDGDAELPAFTPELETKLDATRVVELLGQVTDPYRVAVSLFYLEDYSYKEIAVILAVPVGTVRSRISRGIGQLQEFMLADKSSNFPWKAAG